MRKCEHGVCKVGNPCRRCIEDAVVAGRAKEQKLLAVFRQRLSHSSFVEFLMRIGCAVVGTREDHATHILRSLVRRGLATGRTVEEVAQEVLRADDPIRHFFSL